MTINDSHAEALEHLRSVMRAIRCGTPADDFPRDRAASSDIRTGYIGGRPVRRLVITLRSPGCGWIARGGGCVMCGHYAGTTRGAQPGAGETVAQFEREIARYRIEDISVLSIYNSGSVLNPAEVGFDALRRIFETIRPFDSIRKVVLETRTDYIRRAAVEELSSLLGPDRRLSIAVGLETSDDLRRDLCVNKGCTLAEIESALRSIDGIAESQVYVFFGLPFLTEREAIDDAVETIRTAHDMGADEIHIEPATLQRHTLTWELARLGLYRLPSLHSLYDVLRRVVPAVRPYVSPFMHMPAPDFIPQGCPSCTERLIHGLLRVYNIRRDRLSLDVPACPCRDEWLRRLAEIDERPLPDRVTDALSRLACLSPSGNH